MMRNLIALSFFTLITNILLGQFIYDSGDYVNVNEVYIYTNAISADLSADFSSKGENVIWDFTELTSTGADSILFFDPNDSGYRFYYCLTNAFFLNCQSKFDELTNLAELSVDSFIVGDFRTSKITRHYHLSDSEFAETMLGVTAEIGGIDVPIAIDLEERDVILNFPLGYGKVDSSNSKLILDLNDVGFNASLVRNRKRVNVVEAYGSLKTPAMTYDEVLKMKTLIYNSDSTSLDSFSIPLETLEVEYKWFAKGVSGHVMIASGAVIGGTELITRIQFLGIENVVSTTEILIDDIDVYPNPFRETLHVNSDEKEFTSFELVNQLGQRALSGIVNTNQINIAVELASGVYYLILRDDGGREWARKVVRR